MFRPRPVRALIAVATLAAGLAAPLVAVAPAAAADPPPAAAPTVVGHACPPGVGVTEVVDFTATADEIHLGCAVGPQTNGFTALHDAGFTTSSESGAGTVCTIDGAPVQGYPYCWTTGGYWSYWTTNASGWTFRTVGAGGTGTLPVGAVEGWSWAPAFDGNAPRLAPADLAALVPDCSLAPTAPVLSIIDDDEVLPFALADGDPVEVAVLGADDPVSGASFTTTSSLALSAYDGPTRVVARRAGGVCPDAPVFDATYDVRDTYPGRWSTDPANPAVDKDSRSIVGWATGYSSYTPGAGVSASFQTPDNALGPVSSGLVVLGDRGEITLTFDAPITDGPGYDLAVYENGFAVGSGALDFLELGYVEVSSDGTHFARFDTGSRRTTPVGGFAGQLATELGGMAGRDLVNKGTPFDLSTLANQPAVRSGQIDLTNITHLRVRDITGDGADLDSFGRPIYDAYPTTGSAGYDLTGVAVLHQATVPTPTPGVFGDFTGDGLMDQAVFRPSTGRWFVLGGASTTWGTEGDVPVPADYDGDGTIDVAVFRPSTGRWFIDGQPSVSWGTEGDVPVPADYDGDGTTDVAVFRPSTGRWFIDGQPSVSWGTEGDVPVPADYDGDGTTDVAVFRPSTGRWFVLGVAGSVGFGTTGDIPVPGDYDGDGTIDIAVFRPSAGRWYINGQPSVSWGTVGDIPVPGQWDADPATDIAVFRPSSNRWSIVGGPSVVFGTAGDVVVSQAPATRASL